MVWWLMVGFLVADSGVAARRLPQVAAALMLSVVSVLAVNALSLARNDRIYERSVESATAIEAYELLDQAASHRPFDDLSYVLMGVRLSQIPDIRVVTDGIERIHDGTKHNRGQRAGRTGSDRLADTGLPNHIRRRLRDGRSPDCRRVDHHPARQRRCLPQARCCSLVPGRP